MAKGKKKVNDANEDDFEVIDKTELEEEEVKAPAPKGGKKSRKAKKEAELEEAQRELEALNDGDLEPEQQPSKPANNKKANKKAKAKVESDKEDSDDEVVNEKPKVCFESLFKKQLQHNMRVFLMNDECVICRAKRGVSRS